MTMRKLEQYLRDNIEKGIIDFSLRAAIDDIDRRTGEKFTRPMVTFYIHPANVSGDTADFIVSGTVSVTVQDSNEYKELGIMPSGEPFGCCGEDED